MICRYNEEHEYFSLNVCNHFPCRVLWTLAYSTPIGYIAGRMVGSA